MSLSPIHSSNPSIRKSFLSGALAQSAEVVILGHLLDRIRVEQEVHLHLRPREAVASIWSKGRSNALYKGLKWNVTSAALKGSCGWSLHNISNRCVTLFYPQKDPAKPSFSFTASVALGVAFLETSMILCPLERLKTVEMTSDSQGISKIVHHIKNEGAGFFYRGWRLVMLRQTCSWIGYLGVYQQLRQRALTYNENQPLSLIEKGLLGGTTGALVTTINAPLDLLKTRAQKADPVKVESIYAAAKLLLKNHGLRGLYNGLTMKVCRHMWSSAVSLIVLDHLDALPVNMKV